MNDKQRESLSAFLDGELTDPEVIESLVKQNGCNKNFAALCQQRDALHGQINNCLPVGFADQVARAIADEPTVLSPAASRSNTPLQQPKEAEVVQGWFGGRAPSVAIAASVAALGFVGLVMLSEGDRANPELLATATPLSAVKTVSDPLVAVAPNLSVRQEAVRPVTSDVRSIDFNSLSPQLRTQLLQHMELVRSSERASNRAQATKTSAQAGN